MKILLISHKFYPDYGGIESVSEILADGFVQSGHEVHVLTWTEGLGSRLFSFTIIRKPSSFQILKEFNWADIIFENNPSMRLTWSSFLFKKPLVIGIQTWVARNTGKVSLLDRLKLLRLRMAKEVIACSSVIKESTFSSALVIENPYNELLFKITNTKERVYDFVFLGRLVSDKGADIAIKAIKKIQSQVGKPVSLTIVGDGPEKEHLIQLGKNLSIDNIFFTGKLTGEQLVDCLNKHRYALVPSIWKEPFGIVALELMACGCIPIVSDGGGLPQAVGEAGLTFKRGDVGALVDTATHLLTNPNLESKLRLAAPQHLTRHGSKAVTQKYLQILSKVIGNG